MLVALTYHSKTAEVCSTDKNKGSYDFTVCLPFWDSLTGSQQQMLRLNTIVRSYRAGDDVIFSMPEKNGLFLVLSGGLRVFIATDTGREITLMSIVSGAGRHGPHPSGEQRRRVCLHQHCGPAPAVRGIAGRAAVFAVHAGAQCPDGAQ